MNSRPKRALPPARPLPVGAKLQPGYEVRSVLGTGPFGIVYRVHDAPNDRDLAVKEYLPNALAHRQGTTDVQVRPDADADAFALGMRFFVDEARLLAGIEHPALVRVHGCWREHGTAYMAMALVNGRTLIETAQARWKPPREAILRAMLDTLLELLERLHDARLQHRDISPFTVVFDPNGRPLLMDMGSPRRVTSARGDTGPTGPRDGYAPIELYGRVKGNQRGPWTDIYSLGATMHFLICGRAPPPAPRRPEVDHLTAAMLRKDGRYSVEFVSIIDWMLAPRPADRPRSVAQLRKALAGGPLPEAYAPPRKAQLGDRLRRRKRWLWGGAIVALLAGGGLGAVWYLRSRGFL